MRYPRPVLFIGTNLGGNSIRDLSPQAPGELPYLKNRLWQIDRIGCFEADVGRDQNRAGGRGLGLGQGRNSEQTYDYTQLLNSF
jgi:hypothetical protein